VQVTDFATVDPASAVVEGAAMYAEEALMKGSESAITLQDTIPLPLGVRVTKGEADNCMVRMAIITAH
jgi:molecular chaperone DnaK (HSP70)